MASEYPEDILDALNDEETSHQPPPRNQSAYTDSEQYNPAMGDQHVMLSSPLEEPYDYTAPLEGYYAFPGMELNQHTYIGIAPSSQQATHEQHQFPDFNSPQLHAVHTAPPMQSPVHGSRLRSDQGSPQDRPCGYCAVAMLEVPHHQCIILHAPCYGVGAKGNGKSRCQLCTLDRLTCVPGESVEENWRKQKDREDNERRRGQPKNYTPKPRPILPKPERTDTARQQRHDEIVARGQVQDSPCGQCAVLGQQDPNHRCIIYNVLEYGTGAKGGGKLMCQMCHLSNMPCVPGESADKYKRKESSRRFERDRRRRPEGYVHVKRKQSVVSNGGSGSEGPTGSVLGGFRARTPQLPLSQEFGFGQYSAQLQEPSQQVQARQGGVQNPPCGQCLAKSLEDPSHQCFMTKACGRPKCDYCTQKGLVCVFGETLEEWKRKQGRIVRELERGPRPSKASRAKESAPRLEQPPAVQQPVPKSQAGEGRVLPSQARVRPGQHQPLYGDQDGTIYVLAPPVDYTNNPRPSITSWLLPGNLITHDREVARQHGDLAQGLVRRYAN